MYVSSTFTPLGARFASWISMHIHWGIMHPPCVRIWLCIYRVCMCVCFIWGCVWRVVTGVGSATIRACVAAAGGRKHREGQQGGREGHRVRSNTLGESRPGKTWEQWRGWVGGWSTIIVDGWLSSNFPQAPELTMKTCNLQVSLQVSSLQYTADNFVVKTDFLNELLWFQVPTEVGLQFCSLTCHLLGYSHHAIFHPLPWQCIINHEKRQFSVLWYVYVCTKNHHIFCKQLDFLQSNRSGLWVMLATHTDKAASPIFSLMSRRVVSRVKCDKCIPAKAKKLIILPSCKPRQQKWALKIHLNRN